jgi:hypothetical protein
MRSLNYSQRRFRDGPCRGCVFTTFIVLALSAAPCTTQAQEHWTLLADGVGARIDIDTSSTVRGAHTVTAWLRYFLNPQSLEYHLERTQVDCQNRRSRVLERRPGTDRPPLLVAGAHVEQAPFDSEWASYPRESLGSEVINAVCRITQISYRPRS